MKTIFKVSLLALLAAAAGAAQADTAETKGGLTVKTDDGRFSMTIGGRIHLDGDIVEEDKGSGFDSGAGTNAALSTVFFRRLRVNFAGKAYGWEYLIAPNFAQSDSGNLPGPVNQPNGTTNNTNGTNTASNPAINFEEVYIAKELNLFKNANPNVTDKAYFGQFKPFRGMEELTSSNEITMLERPITSATGVYSGRQYQIGVGYQVAGTNWNVAGGGYNLRADNTPANEGIGYSARAVYAPILDTRTVLHLGVSGGQENPADNQNYGTAYRFYGRRGTNQVLATTTGATKLFNLGAEIAGVFGPFYYQTEYARADYDQARAANGVTPPDSKVDVFAGTISYNVFGEIKPYDIKAGVFKNIKPNRDFGALELTARIDYGKNRTTTVATDVNRIREYIAGFNFYFNPSVRAMFNYIHGEAERVNGQKDRPRTFAARLQYAF